MSLETAVVEAAGNVEGLKAIGAGLATMGMIGSGIGLGTMFSKFFEAVARQPSVKNDLFMFVMIGLGVIEAIAIFAFVLALLIIFVL